MTTRRPMNRLSRHNQPRPCRQCSKLTTWSEANGYGGLELCRACFEAATVENEHYDGYHDAPVPNCPLCQKEVTKKLVLSLCPGAYEMATSRQVWIQDRDRGHLCISKAISYEKHGAHATKLAWEDALSHLPGTVDGHHGHQEVM